MDACDLVTIGLESSTASNYVDIVESVHENFIFSTFLLTVQTERGNQEICLGANCYFDVLTNS